MIYNNLVGELLFHEIEDKNRVLLIEKGRQRADSIAIIQNLCDKETVLKTIWQLLTPEHLTENGFILDRKAFDVFSHLEDKLISQFHFVSCARSLLAPVNSIGDRIVVLSSNWKDKEDVTRNKLALFIQTERRLSGSIKKNLTIPGTGKVIPFDQLDPNHFLVAISPQYWIAYQLINSFPDAGTPYRKWFELAWEFRKSGFRKFFEEQAREYFGIR